MLVSGCKVEDGGQWVDRVQILFRISIGGSNESREYTFFQYIKVALPIHKMNKTSGCVCLSCSISDEVDHRLKRGTSISI